jgi:Generalcontrol nonderepressible 1 (Gcn1) N-terminal
VHLAIESKFPEIRRSVNKSLVQATARAPQLANRLIGDALTSSLSRGHPSSKAAIIPVDDQVQPWNKQSRLSTLLLSVVSFADDVDLSLREKAVVEHIVLAHHCLLCSSLMFGSTYIRFIPFCRWSRSADVD